METPSPIEEQVFRPNRTLKVQAQRKFAQGYGPGGACFTPLKNPPHVDFLQAQQTPRKEVSDQDIDSLPATEDFLDFLCYRETRLYQPKFDVFLKLKQVKSWKPTNDDQAKDDSDDTEDEPLIKLRPEKQEEIPIATVARSRDTSNPSRRARTKTFPLTTAKKKKRKVVVKKPVIPISRRNSISSSEESLSSLRKPLNLDDDTKPKKRFPMLRPIAVGTPKKKDTLNGQVTEDPVRTLRARRSVEKSPSPAEFRGRPSKRAAKAISESEATHSDESSDEVRPSRSKQKVEVKRKVNKNSVKVKDKVSKESSRESVERRKSDEIPLIRLKRLKVDETQREMRAPVERVKNLRAGSLSDSPPRAGAGRTRRGSLPVIQPQMENEKTGHDESDSPPKEKKTVKEENKNDLPKSEKKNQKRSSKASKKSTSFFEKLKTQGYISGSKLNIYDGCNDSEPGDMVEAPVFRPTEEEFNNPFEYIEKIASKAEKFGICKIIPPSSFKPSCVLNEDLRFVGYKQHVHKLFDRFGPNVKEYSAIRRHLLTQGIDTSQIPTIAGLELDLPMLSAAVAANGGLNVVTEEKKWSAVSDFLRAPKWAQDRSSRLDELYIKYLLAYDLLSTEEREKFYLEAESAKENRFVKRMKNEPVEMEDDPLQEKDECTIKGRSLSLKDFKRLARNASAMLTTDSDTCDSIEARFWRLVETQLQHTCVLIGSVDAGETGCGFATTKSPFAKHPWNPKIFTSSSESVLRSMSTVIGVTAPILHFGMVFSACCWFRDPHGLPWIEFMHSGSPRVWYGLSVEQEPAFRDAVQKLWPGFIQNKRVWLPSDAVMISPTALQEHGIELSRTVQQPGEFIVVFPRAFTNSISTGYSVSESAYFAPTSWLKSAPQVFADARESSEPTMFSLDRLLVSMVQDQRLSLNMLQEIESLVEHSIESELAERAVLEKFKLKTINKDDMAGKTRSLPTAAGGSQWECDVCRVSLFYSRIYREADDTSHCLRHGLENLLAKKKEVASFVHVLAYTEDALRNIVDQVKSRLSKKHRK